MKKIVLLLFLFSSFINPLSADSIPNAGFESWLFSQWFPVPSGWQTNNSHIMAATVVPDSNPKSGLLGMRLTNQGALRPHASAEFAVTQTHSDVGVYVHPFLMNNDSALIEVRFYYNSQLVDSGFATIYNGILPGYFVVIVPITQNSSLADTCRISIYGGSVYQSDIVFDDIQFDFLSGIDEYETSTVRVYPNPAVNYIFVDKGISDRKIVSAYAIAVNGQREILNIKTENNGVVLFDTANLSAGIWALYLKDDQKTYSAIFVKEE